MTISTKDALELRAIMLKGKGVVDRALAEGRELTATELAEAMAGLDAAAKATDAAKATAAVKRPMSAVEREVSAMFQPGYKSDRAPSGDRLSFGFKAASAELLDKISETGRAGVKGLLAVGSTATLPMDLGDDVTAIGRPAASIFDVLPSVAVEGGAASWLTQTGRDMNAAPVAAGAEKPVSSLTVKRTTAELAVIAHVVNGLSVYDLADNAALRTFVESELAWGLSEAVAAQVINGTGTAPQLRGILATSGILTQAHTTSAVLTLRHALGQLDAKGYTASAMLLHPSDWLGIETATLSNGAFMLGAGPSGVPVDSAARRLWGVPVALTTKIAAGTGLVLGDGAATIYHDGNVSVAWDASAGFTTNELRVRVEGRYQLGVNRPDAVVAATLTA